MTIGAPFEAAVPAMTVAGTALGGPIGGALVSGGASLLGGMFANSSNSRQARRQMRFQEHMSNTAHQREVKDLAAAGLNPILSGTGGHGASSAQGAAAQMQDVISPSVQSAQAARRLHEEVSLMKHQQENTSADTQLKHDSANKAVAEKNLTNTLQDESLKRQDQIDAQTRNTQQQTALGQFETLIRGIDAGAHSKLTDARVSSAQSGARAAQHDPTIKKGEADYQTNRSKFEQQLGEEVKYLGPLKLMLDLLRSVAK